MFVWFWVWVGFVDQKSRPNRPPGTRVEISVGSCDKLRQATRRPLRSGRVDLHSIRSEHGLGRGVDRLIEDLNRWALIFFQPLNLERGRERVFERKKIKGGGGLMRPKSGDGGGGGRRPESENEDREGASVDDLYCMHRGRGSKSSDSCVKWKKTRKV